MNSPSRTHSVILCLSLAGGLILFCPNSAWAEDFVSYKYEDYRESGGRIAVQTHGVLIDQQLGADLHLKLQGIVDAISGATPTGAPAPAGTDQVPLATLEDRRKAWSADFSRQFPIVNLSVAFANSREHDYVSKGWSLNSLTDFNQKNTTLLAGVAGTSDDVLVPSRAAWAKKRTNDAIVGITQLIDPRTSVSFNFTVGRATGYLNDPYKLVQKRTEVNPGDFLNLLYDENRPDTRNKWIAVAGLNHAFPELNGAFDGSYRFYHDSFGTDAHTVEFSWLQRCGKNFVVVPELRFYDQSSADFYYYSLDQTPIAPPSGPPTARAPFYSSDYRLSELHSFAYGLKVVWTPSPRLQFDVDLKQYEMRGTDGITPASAYPRAIIVTAGLKFSW